MSDDAPISSYSDPIYDRLDAFGQHLRRQWPVYVLAIVLVTITTVVVATVMRNRPDATAAAEFSLAIEEQDEAKRAEKLKQVGAGTKSAFRVIALNELVGLKLKANDLAAARTTAEEAVAAADAGEDAHLQLVTRLSQAAVSAQAGDYPAAAEAYRKVVTRAGSTAKLAAERLAGQLGAAQALAKQNTSASRQEAIELLEPLLTRSDESARHLLELGTGLYWRLRREQAEAALGGSATAAAAATSTTAAATSASAASVPAPAASTAAGPAQEPAVPAAAGTASAAAPATPK
ncbi:hypothetical protein LBMAG53_25770 [Planctomycetota bacterium]|nr:hypothetical protein LBMAG53_25770 [Planctomycetota bacterium]